MSDQFPMPEEFQRLVEQILYVSISNYLEGYRLGYEGEYTDFRNLDAFKTLSKVFDVVNEHSPREELYTKADAIDEMIQTCESAKAPSSFKELIRLLEEYKSEISKHLETS